MAEATGTLATAAVEPAAPAAATIATEAVAATEASATTPAATQSTETPAAAAAPAATATETPEAKATREAAEAAAVVPEKYEFKTPEGVTLDAEVATELEAYAKANKLTQGDAQKIADLKVAEQTRLAAAQTEWRTAAEADSEFGGPKLKENLAIAQKALQFASPQMKTMLERTKLGNNPEVIRWMYRVGQKLGEDVFVPSPQGGPVSDADRAKRMYPTMK
jgi:hypothetical protein